MILYTVRVEIARQGELFYARCYGDSAAAVLAEAAATLQRLDPRELALVPIKFEVEAHITS